MAASNKSGLGLVIVGFTFAASGVTFSATGNSAIGIPILAVGLALITAGMATTRKAPPTDQQNSTVQSGSDA
jgi:hypothetical protein